MINVVTQVFASSESSGRHQGRFPGRGDVLTGLEKDKKKITKNFFLPDREDRDECQREKYPKHKRAADTKE